MVRIATIGGYGFSEEVFFGRLKSANADIFVDVRRRRGMRGSRYSFLNSTHLQRALSGRGIRYIHEIGLAPTEETRNFQRKHDHLVDVKKVNRTSLSDQFVASYMVDVRHNFDLNVFKVQIRDCQKMVLFCVECAPNACHRSVAANLIRDGLSVQEPTEHLMP